MMPVCEDCGREYDTARILRIHQTKEHRSEYPWREAAVLEELYLDEGLNTTEIGERFDCNPETVRTWMDRHDIPREREVPAYHNEATLRELYCERRLSARETAEKLECTYASVLRWLEIHGIARRDRVEGISIAARRRPAYYGTNPDGYEKWMNAYDSEYNSVLVHRLLAVAEFGFDAVCGNHVHHGSQDDGPNELPPCEIPWANWGGNLEVMSASEHSKHHHPGLTAMESLRVVELYRNGKTSYRQLGEMFGVSKSAIRGAVKETPADAPTAMTDGGVVETTAPQCDHCGETFGDRMERTIHVAREHPDAAVSDQEGARDCSDCEGEAAAERRSVPDPRVDRKRTQMVCPACGDAVGGGGEFSGGWGR